ncbi:MAG TPA: ABATE domain-containing protein [Polyangiaceae bacterium]|nr:ABATE domain-containing protein [Polyangiaceae bacterium]
MPEGGRPTGAPADRTPVASKHSFHRGSLALDFVGTLGRRGADQPEERIPDPGALRHWLVEARLAAPGRVTRSDYDAAVELRESIYRMGRRALAGARQSAADVRQLNAFARWSRLGTRRLVRAGRESAWDTAQGSRFSLGCIAVDAIRVVTEERSRLTACSLDDCRALLLSHSRSDARRWCAMETCGNRAKVAAFRQRRARELAEPE